ncbi:MAG TPA: rhomboid family intramembrane serine protease [Bdellovibrionota bacterium]|nr:rhomboid family intramembrane serine protease [Bdellovibrionota bacterium]
MMIACFAMFIVQQTGDQFMGTNITGWLGLSPAGFVNRFYFWQLFTYPFLHGDVLHLVLNLMMLAFIGVELESSWGTARFLRYYFFCSSVAGIVYLLLQLLVWGGQETPMVGASGAIYGLLMAYGLLFGERVMLFMMLFPMKAKHFIWILAGIEFMSTVFSGRGGLSSAAHVAGMAAGFVYLWAWASLSVMKKRRAAVKAGRPVKKSRAKGTAQHLRLVINNEKSDDDDDVDSPRTWH